jgi:hypothetical protein
MEQDLIVWIYICSRKLTDKLPHLLCIMYFECSQCGEKKVFFFSWLSGEEICKQCQGQFIERREKGLCRECGTSEDVFFLGLCASCNKLSLKGELEFQKKARMNAEKKALANEKSQERASKAAHYGKDVVSITFGVIALLWFLVMLPAQADFYGIVIGWAIIGLIYLVVKMFSER